VIALRIRGAVWIFYDHSHSLVVAGLVHGLWNGIIYAIWWLGDAFPGVLLSSDEGLTHPEYGIVGVVRLVLGVPLLLLLMG
jgi:hypothetical protein